MIRIALENAVCQIIVCWGPTYQVYVSRSISLNLMLIQVYVDELVEEDYISICRSLFPSIERSLLLKLVTFNKRLYQETMLHHKFGQDGSPWEFNLRDVIRSCQIIQGFYSFFIHVLLFARVAS